MAASPDTAHQGPTPIPLPSSFPVTWQHPDEERLFWTHDRMHFPTATTPLFGSMFDAIFGRGFMGAATFYKMPIGFRARRINTYMYQAVVPMMGTTAWYM